MNGDARAWHVYLGPERNLPIRIGEARYRYKRRGVIATTAKVGGRFADGDHPWYG